MLSERSPIRLWRAIPALLSVSVAAFALPFVAAAQAPELSESDPGQGEVLAAPPDVLHVCFSVPVEFVDSDTFRFTLTAEGRGVGLRVIFQNDGRCADLQAGRPAGSSIGEWTLSWQATADESREEGSGTLTFEVTGEDGATPVPRETPGPSPTAAASATPEGDTPGDADDSGDSDVGLAVVIAAGAVAGVALAGFAGYLLLRRLRR